ncbi:MAG TPA: glycosyltransferase family 39 protein [Gemmatimonadaceae bacterium]|nr:glycosyltransferase family 39 protein [Gemmatimonadaceae bacterium]
MAAAVLIAIGAARIVTTYGVFWQTVDEPVTLAAGMEWLDRGTYTLDQTQPPLARVAVSVGPYADGRQSTEQFRAGALNEGNAILEQGGHYDRTLLLARAGVLPFFILSAFVVWLWARSIVGEGVAVVAVLIYTSLPIVLAHAGLATSDMTITAMLTAYLFALVRTMEAPSIARGVLTGVCAGAALLSNFSAVLFLPAGTIVVVAYYAWTHRSKVTGANTWAPRLLGPAVIGAFVALLTIWTGYRFSPDAAPAFLAGIRSALTNGAGALPNYFLGDVSTRGHMAFFPVAILLKTPLAALALAMAGLIAAFAAIFSGARKWEARLPALLSATLLLCMLTSNNDAGLRQLLPMFPLLAIAAADGARSIMAQRQRLAGRIVVGALLAWLVVSSVMAHPDYLAYFNEAAGQHPERIFLRDDLDSGQDLKRLVSLVKQARIGSVSLAYFGSADPARRGIIASPLAESHPVTGFIAISLWKRYAEEYSWLDRYAPVMTAGKSIWIYHITY